MSYLSIVLYLIFSFIPRILYNIEPAFTLELFRSLLKINLTSVHVFLPADKKRLSINPAFKEREGRIFAYGWKHCAKSERVNSSIFENTKQMGIPPLPCG